MASTKETISKCQCHSSLSLMSVSVGVGTDETCSEIGHPWGLRNEDHPLFNDVILNKLFRFMRGKDLKACRLVCNKWCVLSLPSARSKFTVKLQGNSEEITKSLSDFVEVFKQNKMGIPFVNYSLDPFSTTEGPGQEFLQICGSTAKEVSLMKRGTQVFTVDVEDISEFLKAMPNIEVFRISHRIHSRSGNVVKLFPDDSSSKPTLTFLRTVLVYEDYIDKTSDYCPTFMEEILSIAPNVSGFKVQDSRVDPDRSRIGQLLRAIEKFERQSVIKKFLLINGRPEHLESLKRLAKNGLKLKILDFVRGGQGDDVVSLKFLPELSTLFKNSIEGLQVNEVCPSFSQFPYMPKLGTLWLPISEDFDSKSVNLNKLFPSLKDLALCYRAEEDVVEWEWEEFLPNSEPCPNVKALSLAHVVFKTQVFDHIMNIFPRLTKLELEVRIDGAEILEKIMTEMTQLVELYVHGTLEGIESIDAFFTGIPVQKIQELEHVVTELKEMSVPLRTETIRHYLTRYRHFPSIANLTNLKRLHLSTVGRLDNPEDEDDPFSKMTDVLLYFGLYSMKHIDELNVEFCEFTKAGCEILTAEMGLTKWSFKKWNSGDIIPEAN